MAVLCLNSRLNAQPQYNMDLQIGQILPEVPFPSRIGPNTSSKKISDFKGKLLILDFWATWCAPCLATIPKNEALQRKFSKELQFINVGYEPEATIRKIYNRLYPKNETDILWLTEDKTLVKMFPHTYLPHYVWIDRTGRYVAATELGEITEENIMSGLKGDFSKLKPKTDKAAAKVVEVAADKDIVFESVLKKYQPGGRSHFKFFASDSLLGRRCELDNLSLISLFWHAYRRVDYFNSKNTRLEVSNPDRLSSSLSGEAFNEWMGAGHGFTWHVRVPIDHSLELFMQQQLKFYFPQYASRVDQHEKLSLVLERTSDLDKLKTKGGTKMNTFSATNATLKNVPIVALFNQLKAKYMQTSKLPLINGTGYTELVDIELNADLSDIDELNTELAKYDLRFVEKMMKVNILVITDTATGNTQNEQKGTLEKSSQKSMGGQL